MKYDPNLMLQLAKLIEAKPDRELLSVDQIKLPMFSRDQLCEHLVLLEEADLIVSSVQFADDKVHDILVSRLTLTGHKFLQKARDDVWWRKFIQKAESEIGFFTRQGMLVVFTHYLTQSM